MGIRRAGRRYKRFLLFNADAVCSRTGSEISEGRGERLVLEGKARHVMDERERVMGYQILKPKEAISQGSKPSCVAFSRAEVEAITDGVDSETIHLSEEQRMSRVDGDGRRLPMVDVVEAAWQKLAVYRSAR